MIIIFSGYVRKRDTKKGNSWQIIIELGEDETGGRCRKFITVRGTKKEAQAIMHQKLQELSTGLVVEETKLTVKQHMQIWFDNYVVPNLQPTTIDGYKVNIEKHINPYIGSIPIQSLKPQHVENLYKTLLDKGLSAKSIVYVHRNLSQALQSALTKLQISRNVAALVKPPKQIKFKPNVLEESDIIMLLQAVKDTKLELPVTISTMIGLRRGEVLGLKWSDIDFERKNVSIKHNLTSSKCAGLQISQPKTSASIRTIDIPEGLVALLEKNFSTQLGDKAILGDAYQNNDLVCCKKDGSILNPNTISASFLHFLRNNNLKEIRFHDLRHSNATLMLKYKVPIKVASQRLGHSSVKITMDIYTHVLDEMDRDAANKLNEGIFGKMDEIINVPELV